MVKGFTPVPPDICTRGTLCLPHCNSVWQSNWGLAQLCTTPDPALTILVIELNTVYPTLSTKPKFILCSSMGMGKKAHKILPFG